MLSVSKMSEKKRFSLSVRKQHVQMAASETAEKATAVCERIRQKKNKIIASIPVINKISERIKKFDDKMTEKHGHVYTKIRDSVKNTVRTVAAYQIFGVPGVIGLCAYKTGEKAFSLLRPACEAKKKGEVASLGEYFKKHRNECNFTMTSAALSIASTAANVAGLQMVADAVRVGKASLLAAPELKNTIKSTGDWIKGKQSFKEVRRDAAVLGITIATYFAGPAGVPMTRGEGKPLEERGQKKTEEKESKQTRLQERQKRREEKALRDMEVQKRFDEFHEKRDQYLTPALLMRNAGR